MRCTVTAHADSSPSTPDPEQAASDAPEQATVETASTDTPEAVVDASAAAPSPVPAPPRAGAPVPGPRPRPFPRATSPAAVPTPPAAPAPAEANAAASEPWGRVAEDGTVSVREGDQWREIGQYPDGTPDEALAYFERKFADLADKVALLEQRHAGGGAAASELRSTAASLSADIDGAAAVGDLAGLKQRVDTLAASLSEASQQEAAEQRAAVDAAIAHRTTLVEQAEQLAARDPKTVQWKQAGAEMSSLFDQWQEHQKTGPRLPKSVSQKLWKRFRDARATVDKHRREFYAELDDQHKGARDRKTRLIERAEALAPKGEDGIPAYRSLLDDWKQSGRAGKKADDALWARFKAAGDVLYGARAERDAAEAEASLEKIDIRRGLLDEARAVGDEKDLAKARSLLTGIQRRWDDVGRIFPRDKERALDEQLRKIEQALRAREDRDWKQNDPETKARANDMTRQLTEAIDKLQAEVDAARASGDKRALAKAEEALAARQAWLGALGG